MDTKFVQFFRYRYEGPANNQLFAITAETRRDAESSPEYRGALAQLDDPAATAEFVGTMVAKTADTAADMKNDGQNPVPQENDGQTLTPEEIEIIFSGVKTLKRNTTINAAVGTVKAVIQRVARTRGISASEYVRAAIYEKLERDGIFLANHLSEEDYIA